MMTENRDNWGKGDLWLVSMVLIDHGGGDMWLASTVLTDHGSQERGGSGRFTGPGSPQPTLDCGSEAAFSCSVNQDVTVAVFFPLHLISLCC